jgi:hypothetical protein
MRIERLSGIWVVCLSLLLLGLGCSSTGGASQDQDELLELEQFLLNAQIIEIQEDKELGTTDPWIVILRDGRSERRAMFKHMNRCRPNFMADCYKYELAAYELSKLMDLRIVPPVVPRTVKGTQGSLQIMVEGCISLQNYSEFENVNSDRVLCQMLDIMVFENLVYLKTGGDDINEDILYHPENGRICHVDFAKAFDTVHDLLGIEREVMQCSQALYTALSELDDEKILTTLADYLNEDELSALLTRKRMLVDSLTPRK